MLRSPMQTSKLGWPPLLCAVLIASGCAASKPSEAQAPADESAADASAGPSFGSSPEGASQAPGYPQDQDRTGAMTLDDAAKSLDQAERELAGLGIGEAQSTVDAPSAGAEKKSERDGEAAGARAAPMAKSPADRCTVACRALASMQRSAERLCDLSGDGDTRCSDAQGRVDRASRAVKSACPGCRADLFESR